MTTILHITQRQQWALAQRNGHYWCDSLQSEGFIHCSTAQQIVKVANTFYPDRSGLVLLCIETDRLQSPLRYDLVEGGEVFPHLYGPLNLDAVLQVLDFEPNPNGKFDLPAQLIGEV
jgi:uncharacterized protein (DUF952 family)